VSPISKTLNVLVTDATGKQGGLNGRLPTIAEAEALIGAEVH